MGSGLRGGPLHETTQAWMSLILAICHGMKSGYTDNEETEDFEEDPQIEELCSRKSFRTPVGSFSPGNCRLLEKRQGIVDTNLLELQGGANVVRMKISRQSVLAITYY